MKAKDDLNRDLSKPQPGWTLLPDESEAKIMSGGQPLSVQIIPKDETPEDRRRREQEHKAHVLAFKAEVTEQRLDASRKTTPATGPRPRGGGRPRARAARSGSSSSSDPDEPEPPRRRLCAFCGREISGRSAQARYCTDKHADRDRQRRKRARDRERAVAKPRPVVWGGYKLQPGEYAGLLRLANCRCNGHHILAPPDDPPSPRCIKCGRLCSKLFAVVGEL
jgi:hypothetical protein